MKDTPTDLPLPKTAKRQLPTEETSPVGVGDFFAQHRALVDARKVHLARVGIGPAPPEAATPTPIAMPSQAKMLAMPTDDTPVGPPVMADAPAVDGAQYKPRRIPADATNLEA